MKSPPFAINCSPLLHGNFSQGVIPEKFSLCSPLLVIPEKSFHCSPLQPTLTCQFQSGELFLKRPLIAAHCSPLLHGNFSQGVNSWKVLPLQPIAAHSYMAISVGGGVNSWKVLPLQPIVGNSWKVFPLQPIAAHSYMTISVRGQFLKSPHFAINCSPLLHGNFTQGVIPEKFSLCSPLLVIPEKSFHCSPLQLTLTWQFKSGAIFEKSSLCNQLQPTLTWQFQSGGNSWRVLLLQPIVGNSWKVLPLQPIAAHSYMAISVRGVIPEKASHCSPLQPTLTWQFQSGG